MDCCEDPNDELNSSIYHTGQPCLEKGCTKPAGTGWSPFWCQACNAARMKRISQNLEEMLKCFEELDK
jgi:hypothetical protein